MPSSDFARFRHSFFEDRNSARDGLDTAALGRLAGAERTAAEGMLLDALPDTRAVIGLGVLRAARAETALMQIIAGVGDAVSDPERVELARALWRIRPDQRWCETLTRLLATGEAWTVRLGAAVALRDVADVAAVSALAAALDDREALVRHHAAVSLLALHDRPHQTSDPQHMIYRVMSEDEARRNGGRQDVLAAIAGCPLAPR
ncbi:MAG: HEAT repeat domain-containing protein [Hyphomicrobiaceae bacterium]